MAEKAVLLAAGRGTRLGQRTLDRPKCLLPVAGRPLLRRTLETLQESGVKELVVATGYRREEVEGFLNDNAGGLGVQTVYCEDFALTNNIVSLWRVGPEIRGDFYLVECDLVFDAAILRGMRSGTAAAVSPLRDWMDGTVVAVGADGAVERMYVGKAPRPSGAVYKTINIYRVGAGDWERSLWPRLDAAVGEGRVNVYYEQVFAEAVEAGEVRMEATAFDPEWWREIDDETDLQAAEEWLSQKQ